MRAHPPDPSPARARRDGRRHPRRRRAGLALLVGVAIAGALAGAATESPGAAAAKRTRRLIASTTTTPAQPAATATRAASSLTDAELADVAARNGLTVEQLHHFRADATSFVDSTGRLLFVDPPLAPPTGGAVLAGIGDPEASPLPGLPGAPSTLSQLHSLPTSTHKLYLDINGATITSNAWNAYTGQSTHTAAPFDLDGSPGTLSSTEAAYLRNVWSAVAEDFAPFDLDVTYEQPTTDQLIKSSVGDTSFGTTIVITPDNWICPATCSGIAYVGVTGDSYYQPGWAFYSSWMLNYPDVLASTISHETGHTLGLSHDGANPSTAYYPGHGVWGPIMGSTSKAFTQWSRGEYANANNTEDDLAIIAGLVGPRVDDVGDTTGTAAVLTDQPTASRPSQLIGSDSDVDVYRVHTTDRIRAQVVTNDRSPNVALRVVLRNLAGTVLDTTTSLGTPLTIDHAGLAPGDYELVVSGEAYLTPSTGFSGYGSIGLYGLTVDTVFTPGQPTGVGATRLDRALRVTWAPPATGGAPLTYRVTVCEPDTGCGSVRTLTSATSSLDVSNLVPGRTYQLQVTAANAWFSGAPSAVFTSATVIGAPDAPPTTFAESGGVIHLAWSAPAANGSTITGYEVERSVVPGGPTTITATAATSFDATVPNLPSGSTYGVRVRAVSDVGPGAWSRLATSGRTSPATAGPSTTVPRGTAPAATAVPQPRGAAPGA